MESQQERKAERTIARVAREARAALLERIAREKGRQFKSVDEAISQGAATDLDWCAELDAQRERFGLGTGRLV